MCQLNWRSLLLTSMVKNKKALTECMTSECFRVFHTATHVQSCNLQNITATLYRGHSALVRHSENPLLFLAHREAAVQISQTNRSLHAASLPLSRCHSAFSSLCVCDQSGVHHHSVAGWCGFSPQTSFQGVRALSCHMISSPIWEGSVGVGRGKEGKGASGLTHATRGSAVV